MFPNIIKQITQKLLLASLLATPVAWAENGQIVLTLDGVKNATGKLRASLYNLPETFRKEDKALKVINVPAVEGKTQIIFKDLPPGRYAIMAYHDENADERLKLRFGMFPLEGYGLSNNPKVMGPPKFADSAFEHAGTTTNITIPLTY
jgi:uncharacterized protein (DUF2141 family)